MNTGIFFSLDIAQLGALFYFAYSKASLLFFLLGIPLGLVVVDKNQHRRLLYIQAIVIPSMELFAPFLEKYWFLYTLEGLAQVVIVNEFYRS